MKSNPKNLTAALQKAGITFSGCSASGIVWDEDGTTEIQDRLDVLAVIEAHDPEDHSEAAPAAAHTLLSSYKSQDVGTIPVPAFSGIVRALCQLMGLADDTGKII